jgi:hypothetical protein
MHRARIDVDLDWLRTRLHFGHALPDCCGQQTVPLEVRQLTFLLQRDSRPRPLAKPEVQGEIHRVPYTRWSS